jgi:hypothetical protein
MDTQLTQISRGWQNVRRAWFRIALNAIFEDSAAATAHVEQEGRAELAMRAYQLTDAIRYIASNSYIGEPLLPELFEKLTVMLSDTEQQHTEIIGYFRRYKAVIENDGEFLRFASDVAAHCTGEEFTPQAIGLTALIPLFLAHSRWVVSKAFADTSQMRKIEDWLNTGE